MAPRKPKVPPAPFIEKHFIPMPIDERNGGPQGFNKDEINTPEAIFNLFFDHEVLHLLVVSTNARAEAKRAQIGETRGEFQRPWSPISEAELRAWLGKSWVLTLDPSSKERTDCF
jgi:hypothetical protein